MIKCKVSQEYITEYIYITFNNEYNNNNNSNINNHICINNCYTQPKLSSVEKKIFIID